MPLEVRSRQPRRRKERFPLNLSAQIAVVKEEGSEIHETQTSEVSSVGGFFAIDQPIEIGSEVEIDLVLSLEKLQQLSGTHARVKLSGLVVRKEEKGVAVCFDEDYEMSPVDKA